MQTKYTRQSLQESTPTNNKSEQYWRKQACEILASRPGVELVEVIHSGRKMDSEYLRRGARHSIPSVAVVIASTGGKWGKSRRNFYPVK